MQVETTNAENTPESHRQTPVLLRFLTILSSLCLAAAVLLVTWLTPREAVMGDVQKVFYFHLSSAWVGAVAFLVAAAGGVLYLIQRRPVLDNLSLSSIEIGTLFSVITILSGMTWARPVWNTWWTWDPRLTTTAIMLLVYMVYFLLRRMIPDEKLQARLGAVYAILGFLSVPVTFLSIRLLRTIHPVLFGSPSSADLSFALSTAMLRSLLFCLFAFSLLYGVLLWHRMRLEKLKTSVRKKNLILPE